MTLTEERKARRRRAVKRTARWLAAALVAALLCLAATRQLVQRQREEGAASFASLAPEHVGEAQNGQARAQQLAQCLLERIRLIAHRRALLHDVCDSGRFVVGIAGEHVRAMTSKGIVAVSGAEINKGDVDRANAAITPLDADFQRFITETAWGSVWTRDEHLDRSLETFSGGELTRASLARALAARGVSSVADTRLMLDGLTPLEIDGDLFRLRDEPANTEWIRFGDVVNGKCMRLTFSGVDLLRVASA